MKSRIIVFYDSDTNLIIKTNAPESVINEAIKHRNYCFDNDIEISSDFEEIQSYIWDKHYTFEQIGYLNDLESYYW